MIFVNLKAYKQGTGKEAQELAKICQKVAKKEKLEIILAAQAADIFNLTQTVSLPIWSQHVDNIEFGPHTGSILPESVLAAGVSGTILNHSEKKIPFEVIGETVKRAKSLEMKVLVCCESIEEGEGIVKFQPDFLAYEPSEFIGSQEISVATARPEVINGFVKRFSELPIIVGAGVHSFQDVKVSLKLGAKGVLVATDIVLAKNPEKELEELARAFK